VDRPLCAEFEEGQRPRSRRPHRISQRTAQLVGYVVPPSPEAILTYRGLPYDRLEDMLPHSAAWRQVAPLLMPQEDAATGRPITPLHGGHVGLLCTAGLLNGVFGKGEDRHIARCALSSMSPHLWRTTETHRSSTIVNVGPMNFGWSMPMAEHSS